MAGTGADDPGNQSSRGEAKPPLAAAKVKETKARLETPGTGTRFMCRFVPEKHLHDLVETFSVLKKNNRIPADIRLVLAGDTDFEDDYSLGLKEMARKNGVVLTGFIRGKKLHSLLTNALCYSLPSSHEGLPIALLEAMSYKLPVVTSAIPANLEVGLDTKCYHQVGDVCALSDKIEKLCAQKYQRVEYDMRKYNWDNIAKQVNDIYTSLK